MAAPAPQLGQPRRQKVIVAVDESECSRYTLEWTLRNLAPTLAPPLLLLTVQPLVPIGYVSAASFGVPLGTVPVPPELVKSMQEQQRHLTQALLDKAKAICADHGVAVETVVEVGDPKEVICEAAEKRNVDLLVLGSHSRGPIQRLFIGSVSNYCVHHSKCPVLVVKNQC
ncbi:universal stress protein A-like protein [Phragmites australis]|uniref:universal stress protein A-like protein n=1 Tax=Phragmites australis TaxID=29695 RepID=UPI002D76FB8D|nr:universal stress protein A-like protein [Phragmites australis]